MILELHRWNYGYNSKANMNDRFMKWAETNQLNLEAPSADVQGS